MAISPRADQRAVAIRGSGVLLSDPSTQPSVRDAYTQTLLNVRYALYGGGNTLLVSAVDETSDAALAGANLAILAAQEGERVILVDTNSRNPTLQALFGLAELPGFTTLIMQEGLNPIASLQQADIPNLYVLGVEKGKSIPGGLGRARALGEVMQRLKNACDRVILIGAPVLNGVDTLDLCALVDGVVITVYPDRTHREDAGRAHAVLQKAHAPLIGVILSKQGTDSSK